MGDRDRVAAAAGADRPGRLHHYLAQIHKRLPGLPRLHADDQCVLLWLVDEDGRKGEPLLSALVTVGDRQMHPRFPAVAEQLVWTTPVGTRSHNTWSYEVLKVHQHWRHRR
ncbi:hypothetical protein ACFVX6_33235 [Streptomyces sp. NPDC058289]|uniref:hypothetical protein n=1 Tax=Streptomyces sp. NPDC058289 TaxID=3346425 RepID=UPI0036EF8B8B